MMAGMTDTTVYGIPNCDTVRKARDWLSAAGVAYVFHDFKKQGVPAALLPGWLAALGHETLVNRRGPTWRKLPAPEQDAVVDNATAVAVMLAHSSVIKRPVVVWPDQAVTAGFSAELFSARAGAARLP
jgi:Spx/MgsR family transcriptional regulator